MDNVIEDFDAKVTFLGTLHTLTSIKELLCKSRNERRKMIFSSTKFDKWLDIPSFANDNHFLNYIFQHQDAYPWGKYLWRALYRKIANVITRHQAAVMRKNRKNASSEKKKKSGSSKNNETYNVYGFVWSLKIYILEMYKNNKYWWKKDSLVIPRGLSWSKIDGEHNVSITTTPQIVLHGEPIVDYPNFALEQQSESVPMFTRVELVAKHHAIVTNLYSPRMIGCQKIGWPNIKNLFIKNESGDGKLLENEIINVLIGEVSCDRFVPDFCDGESSKLYYNDPKDYPSSSSMTQQLEVAVPDQPFTQMVVDTSMDLNLPNFNEASMESQEMALYLNEVNVVNEKEPPSAEKEKTQSKKLRKRKDAIPQSQTANNEILLVEFCEVYALVMRQLICFLGAIMTSTLIGLFVNSIGFEPRWLGNGQSPVPSPCMIRWVSMWRRHDSGDNESYNIKFVVKKDVFLQGDAYKDCDVWEINKVRGARDTLVVVILEEPIEDQTLPVDASPIALSLGYVVDSDPEKDEEDPKEDPADYPADGGYNDDDESSDDNDDDDHVEKDEEE
uniref:Uncharacterized protein n=1 Tax=Tanacetum cinerariifolium TaxID=118510 RepID=A0A6L2KRJ4_TANCI|nr:hypothetical protein [Tanacetum cinerariifolium]